MDSDAEAKAWRKRWEDLREWVSDSSSERDSLTLGAVLRMMEAIERVHPTRCDSVISLAGIPSGENVPGLGRVLDR